jgi:hypothetical protein
VRLKKKKALRGCSANSGRAPAGDLARHQPPLDSPSCAIVCAPLPSGCPTPTKSKSPLDFRCLRSILEAVPCRAGRLPPTRGSGTGQTHGATSPYQLHEPLFKILNQGTGHSKRLPR